MGHKRMVVLRDAARKELNEMVRKSGMDADELLEMAVLDLAASNKIVSKEKHERLVEVVRHTIGERADDYDTNAIARSIEHTSTWYYVDSAIRGLRLRTWRDGQYLEVDNLAIKISDYEI